MANGTTVRNGNGHIRISIKTIGVLVPLVAAVVGGVQLIRWVTRLEAEVQANSDVRQRIDTAFVNHRMRVNQVLTDQERRLRELEVRAGIRRRAP